MTKIMFTCILITVTEKWFCNNTRVQAKFRINQTFILQVTENWFCNKIAAQAKSPFLMNFYTKISSIIKQRFKLKISFQKNKHCNCYIYN